MPDAAKLKVTGLTSGYNGISVVHDVSLDVRPAEIFALMGKNGMGKTTLLKSILGLIRPAAGAVEVDGKSIAGKRAAELIASGIGYAPQEQPLFQDLTIRDNLRLALRSDRELKDALNRVAGHFPFLRDRLQQKAGTLSGGEQKMLILSRALMLAPKLILIDEISEGLQPSVIDRIAAALRVQRAENGTAVLLVEQHLDFALSVADRWAVLKMGEIDDAGTVDGRARDRIIEHLKI
jgi:ABC-type branched-subunit amino acid transport system ATPase component